MGKYCRPLPPEDSYHIDGVTSFLPPPNPDGAHTFKRVSSLCKMQSKYPGGEDLSLLPPDVDGGMTFLKNSCHGSNSSVLCLALRFLASPTSALWHPENTAVLGCTAAQCSPEICVERWSLTPRPIPAESESIQTSTVCMHIKS